jgi:hypothetical protein
MIEEWLKRYTFRQPMYLVENILDLFLLVIWSGFAMYGLLKLIYEWQILDYLRFLNIKYNIFKKKLLKNLEMSNIFRIFALLFLATKKKVTKKK